MKKYIAVLLLLCFIPVILLGCTSFAAALPAGADVETEAGSSAPAMEVDVDLTVLSSTMRFAEVNYMMENPDQYMGKVIKIGGAYFAEYFEETGAYYHYVMTSDAASCCLSGFEFVLSGEHTYPDDYPDDAAEIEVIGVMESYEELGHTYYYLAVDELLIME